ncbi:MAG: RIP metalloprotease RseP [Bdellovibrionota bacterium]|nr:RIP metalloprotease RseP [Bdellovibrionota bacterium]
MFLEKVVIFVLFLGPLIFFHELGHFLFARLFGVRVEVFSLGFGPKLLKFKKNDTEYALSIIPLGGYVKMFGDDPFDKDGIPEDQKQYSFNHKGKWARFWIVLGGPLANFLLAFFIFFCLLISGERMPEIKVGVLDEKGKLFSQGLRTGDVLKKINNQKIYNISDIALQKGGKVFSVTLNRKELEKTLKVNFQGESFFNEFIKYPPILRKPLLIDPQGKKYIVSEFDDGPRAGESLDTLSV